MTVDYRLTVAGPMPKSLSDTIVARFGAGVRIRTVDGRTMLSLGAIDQPALRGLLILLWDFGHEVLSLSSGAPR